MERRLTACVERATGHLPRPIPADARRDTRCRGPDGQQKTAGPRLGTSGVLPVVPPHFAAALNQRRPLPTRRSTRMRRPCNGSLGLRAPVAVYWGVAATRSGRGSEVLSPAFAIPLRSNRGSLHRSRRGHVLVNARSRFVSPRYHRHRCCVNRCAARGPRGARPVLLRLRRLGGGDAALACLRRGRFRYRCGRCRRPASLTATASPAPVRRRPSAPRSAARAIRGRGLVLRLLGSPASRLRRRRRGGDAVIGDVGGLRGRGFDRGEAEGQRVLDDVAAQQALGFAAARERSGWSGMTSVEHLPDLAHQVDRLVEGQDQIAFGELDLLADLGHGRAAAPGPRRAVEGRVVPFGDEEPVVALLAEDRVLEVLEPAAERARGGPAG